MVGADPMRFGQCSFIGAMLQVLRVLSGNDIFLVCERKYNGFV
jgi:hypothetical protein